VGEGKDVCVCIKQHQWSISEGKKGINKRAEIVLQPPMKSARKKAETQQIKKRESGKAKAIN